MSITTMSAIASILSIGSAIAAISFAYRIAKTHSETVEIMQENLRLYKSAVESGLNLDGYVKTDDVQRILQDYVTAADIEDALPDDLTRYEDLPDMDDYIANDDFEDLIQDYLPSGEILTDSNFSNTVNDCDVANSISNILDGGYEDHAASDRLMLNLQKLILRTVSAQLNKE